MKTDWHSLDIVCDNHDCAKIQRFVGLDYQDCLEKAIKENWVTQKIDTCPKCKHSKIECIGLKNI